MARGDTTTTIEELKQLVVEFGQERGWSKHHSPRSVAMGIAIEAAELMEHYQWEHHGERDLQEVSDELSDVLFNLLNFAHLEGIDVSEAFRTKYAKLQQKYPTTVFSPEHSDPEDYKQIKRAYRAKKADS